ncbi:MAG: carboxypeptidase-like regulatory domain-containing protein, partial [Bacteroidota bacterium]
MRLRTTVLLLVLCPLFSLAQGYSTVRGFVTDASDGEGLQGVNVVLEAENGDQFGVATDFQGFYALSRISEGRYRLIVSYIGYKRFETRLRVQTGELMVRNIELRPDTEELGTVFVETERTSGAANTVAGVQTIAGSDISLVPTPDVSGDLAAYLTTLPGIVTTGDQGGQVYVRGGEPTQNLVLLDGITVYQPFHVLGFFSAFPSDIVNRATLHAGGFRSRYGGRLSSVLDVSARNGNKRQYAGAVSVSPFLTGARIEGPIDTEGQISFLASGRFSTVEDFGSQLVGEDLPFDFSDVFFKTHANLGPTRQLSLTVLRTNDRGSIGVGDEVGWSNTAAGLRFVFLPSGTPMLGDFVFSYSGLDTELGPEDNPLRNASIASFNAQSDLTYFAGNADYHWGFFVRTLGVETEIDGLFQNLASDREFLVEAGAYIEPEIQVNDKLLLVPGVRLQNFPSKRQVFLEPRVRAVYDTGTHAFSAAAGLYHQQIVGLTDRRDLASLFTAWTGSPRKSVPRSFHALLGYKTDLAAGVELALEAYYKDLDQLYAPEWTAFPRFTTNLQQVNGRARGLDARLEVTRGRLYGYVSYGLGDVEYTARQEQYALWYGSEELTFRPPHDRRHQVNALAQTELAGLTLTARWQYGSGLPYSR